MSEAVIHITTPAGEELVLISRDTYEALIAGTRRGTDGATALEPETPTRPVASIVREMAAHTSPLRALRTEAGITQSALAELAGVDLASICALEAGELGIDQDVCTRIASAMNVSAERLLPAAESS